MTPCSRTYELHGQGEKKNKNKAYTESKTNKHLTLSCKNLSPKAWPTPLTLTFFSMTFGTSCGAERVKGVGVRKIDSFFKELTPRSQTYELRSQGEKKKNKHIQNQDKQTPHTVLQKLLPKLTPTPLRRNIFG